MLYLNMIQEKLDHWFRHEYSRMLSLLVSKYGSWQIDSIEDAIHDALHKAMQVWGYKGMPDNPSAWIYRVAQNNLINQFRKNSKQGELGVEVSEDQEPSFSEIKDETLKLFFACCHPQMNEQESIILCLKFAAGFGLHEISRALFSTYEATKKKFQRAKAHFRSSGLSLEIPSNELLKERMDSVLKVIFLIFTEGYRPTDGDQLLKEDVCYEAMRIASAMYRHEAFKTSNLYALLAMMCYKSARIQARMQGGNDFIRLKDQNRDLWEKGLIAKGNEFLYLAFERDNHSEYHFHAAVENQYVTVDSFEKTDWDKLLNIYNYWKKTTKNPALELNRIVVVMHAQGAETALNELEKNCTEGNDHRYHAIKGELFCNLEKYGPAKECFQKMMDLCPNRAEQKLAKKRINEMAKSIKNP